MPTGTSSFSVREQPRVKSPGAGGGGELFSWVPSAPGYLSPLKISPIIPAIGATVEGLSVAKPLSNRNRDHLNVALLKYQVLFFRNQPLTPYQQRSFAKRFGQQLVHPIYPNLGPELPEITVLKLGTENSPDQADHNWHTDDTFIGTPPLGSILSAKVFPSCGGDTLWANGIAAYDALSKSMQTLLLGFTAEPSIVKAFPTPSYNEQPRHNEQASWDSSEKWEELLVSTSLLPMSELIPRLVASLSSSTKGFKIRILGLKPLVSDALLNFLYEQTKKPEFFLRSEFFLRWKWQNNDLAFWDNKVTQHYATADYMPQTRIMYLTTFLGHRPH